MLFKIRLISELLIGNLRKNKTQGLITIFSVLLVVSASIAITGWLEVSPKLAINSAFEDRGYEVSLTEVYFQEDGLEILQEYLATEEIVEDSEIIHKSQFLYNLNNKSPDLNIINPPVNDSDFYISNDDLDNAAYLISDDFLMNIESQLGFENNSIISFHQDGNSTLNETGILISRRLVTILEDITNQTLEIGDNFNFSIAGRPLPDFHVNLSDMLPIKFFNYTINGIFDRLPSKFQSFLGLDFNHETLGDGILLSEEILNESEISLLEDSYVSLGKELFIRIDREVIQKNTRTTRAVNEISYLIQRIYQQGRFRINVDMQDIYATLLSYEQSRIVLLLILLPLLMIAQIFFIAHIPHLLKAREEEFRYLRMRGVTDLTLYIIHGLEVSILTFFGVIIGYFGGTIFIGLLLSTPDFLIIQNTNLLVIGEAVLEQSRENLWVLFTSLVVSLNIGLMMVRFRALIQGLDDSSLEFQKTRILKTQSTTTLILKVLIPGFVIYLILTTLIPMILKELGVEGISHQLVPLLVIILVLLWILFSIYAPMFVLQIIQSTFETLRFFRSSKRSLTWLNLFRRRKQYQSFLTLMTLTISLIVFSLINVETIIVNNEQNADFITGSDLKLVTDTVYVENFTNQVHANVPGVNACLGLPQKTVKFGSVTMVLIGINPDNYTQFTLDYPINVISGPPAERVFLSLSEDPLHGIIISEYMAEVFRLELESTIKAIGLLSGSQEYEFTAKAVIEAAPGIGAMHIDNIDFGAQSFGGFALVHSDIFEAFGLNYAKNFLVKLNTSTTQEEVTPLLSNVSNVRIIYNLESALGYQQHFFKLTGVYGELSLNFLGSILVILLGVAIFYQFLVGERMNEYALFQSFGSTKSRITRIAFYEAVFLIILSLSLGVLTGYLLASGFLAFSQMVITVPNNVYNLQVSVSVPLLSNALAVITLGVMIASFIPLRKIWTFQITDILREE
ncbi:MAG: ABC transporter permease [Candidatus Hodarchaeales archaeon]